MQDLDIVKSIYDDGIAEINGREYKFLPMAHKERKFVFAYTTSITNELEKGNFSFMSSKEFEAVEKVIQERVAYDGIQLSKREKHFDDYPEDYIMFVSSAMGVISYPFLKGNL